MAGIREGWRARRRIVWSAVATVVVIAVVGGLLIARNAGGNGGDKKAKKGPPADPPSPVELSTVTRGGISTWLTATTTLEARNAATLVARVQGQVVALPAEEGQWVGAGAVLARLDDTEARLSVRRAELAAEVAQREADRGRQLAGQGFMSDKDLDDLHVRLRNAQVELEQAHYDLAQTRITAPFAGRVTERMVNLGETVTAGRECFRMADFHPLRARVYFPERDLPRVRVGQEAVLEMDARPGTEIHARVALVNPVVDRSNGTFKVTLEVANSDGALRPGTFARVRLKTGDQADALLMPRRGVLAEDGESYVYVARGDSVARIAVTVGAVENDTAQILSGLAAGDRVVTVGQGGLKPGAKIKAVSL